METPRYYASALHFGDDRFIVVGGVHFRERLRNVEMLTHRDGMWSWCTVAPMITPCGRPGVAPLDDTGERILVTGGWTELSEIFKAPKTSRTLDSGP